MQGWGGGLVTSAIYLILFLKSGEGGSWNVLWSHDRNKDTGGVMGFFPAAVLQIFQCVLAFGIFIQGVFILPCLTKERRNTVYLEKP